MKIKIQILSILFIITASCSDNKEKPYIGSYSMLCGGGGFYVLKIEKNKNFEYYCWNDVGGYYTGLNGKYTISDEKLFINIYYPVNSDTHAVRRDTLFFKRYKDYQFLVSSLSINRFNESLKNNDMQRWYWIDENTKHHSGLLCYMKVDEKDLPVKDEKIEWDIVKNPKSVAIEAPTPPHLPVYMPSHIPIEALPVQNECPEFQIYEEEIKWRLFEKNISDTLRILRNNIFAKYGYPFKSKDLKSYYEHKKWYKANPDYDHSQITSKDSTTIQTILKYENLLGTLSADSVKLLKNIFDFRKQLLATGYDTTITVHKNITGNKHNDEFTTRIKIQNEKIFVENILKNQDQLLWSELFSDEPCVDSYTMENDNILKTYPKYGYFYILVNDYLDTVIPRAEPLSKNYVELQITGNDTSYSFSWTGSNCQDHSNRFKKYLYNFNGNQVLFSQGFCLYDEDVGYDVKVWNKFSNDFVTLWSGP